MEIDGLKKRSAEARGDLDILLRAVRHASPHPDEPGGHRRRLHDSRPDHEEPDGEHDYPSDSPQPEENASKELFALTLRAHEMENVKDLRAKALKKNMNGVMIRHRMTCCMIQKNMNTEYKQHTDERGVIFTHITWLFKETTWGYRFTPWLTAVSRWKDSSRGDRPTISPRSTLHTTGWTRSR